MAAQKITPAPLTRSLREIAREIATDWPRATEPGTPSMFGNVGEHPAHPYLVAMYRMHDMSDAIGWDRADEVVLRFLSNAGQWRGPVAQRVKGELRAALEHHRQQRASGVDARRRETMARYRASR